MIEELRLQEFQMQLHRQFWDKQNQDAPILSYRQGDFFFSKKFKASESLNIEGLVIQPGMLAVEDFLPDYETLYQESLSYGQSAFWTAEPFTAIPWMEAILGCPVIGGTESFHTRPVLNPESPEIAALRLDRSNPWLVKFLEFTDRLVEQSDGRFPVGQPIMRGPSDMIGALVGQTGMVYLMNDDPRLFTELVGRVTDIFLEVMTLQKDRIPAFQGGSAIGFYHLWTPGSCIWFQDDLSSILSPDLYKRFFMDSARKITSSFDWSLFHMHPSSFFILDEILDIDDLDVIQVNKDIGGPSLEEMIPVLQRIQKKKRLLLWGDLSQEDLDLIRKDLTLEGLFLNIVTRDFEMIKTVQTNLMNWY